MTLGAPELSVVVVTFNSEAHIERCLASVEAIEGLRTEVVVVDNASTDGTVELLSTIGSGANVVGLDENIGFGRAVNLAVSETRAPYILLLNPDAVLRPGSAERLLARARTDPEHGLYGGVTIRSDGSVNEHTLRRLPSLLGAVVFATGLSAIVPRLAVERIPVPSHPATAPFITASLLLVDRRVWCELGGFDPRFFMYGEDSDLCRRAVDLGHVPLVDPEVVVVHDGGASTPDHGRKIALMMAGRSTYSRIHWCGWRRTLALSCLRAGVAVRAVGGRLSGQPAWASAWALRDWWYPGYDARADGS